MNRIVVFAVLIWAAIAAALLGTAIYAGPILWEHFAGSPGIETPKSQEPSTAFQEIPLPQPAPVQSWGGAWQILKPDQDYMLKYGTNPNAFTDCMRVFEDDGGVWRSETWPISKKDGDCHPEDSPSEQLKAKQKPQP